MNTWIAQGKATDTLPTIHVVSDSVGATAQAIARAAAASFEVYDPAIEILPRVNDGEQMVRDLELHLQHHRMYHVDTPFVLYYTLVNPHVRKAMEEYLEKNPGIISVDLMSSALEALSAATGRPPLPEPGRLHSVNEYYFRRIEAMEFTISHDDGRNPQDLPEADIVLIGVSRSSKTPLSIYLSQLGYRVANVPLDPQSTPPKEIYEVDPTRLFGLIISPEILSDIRKRRLGNAKDVASSYADLECVYQDLEKARALMRQLGCIVVRTDNRAIEETAQEILRYYENAHPQTFGSRNNSKQD